MKFTFFIALLFIIQKVSFSQGAFYYQHIKSVNNEMFAIAEGNTVFLSIGRNTTAASIINNGYIICQDKQGKLLWDKEVVPVNDSITALEYRTIVFKSPHFYLMGTVLVHNETKYLFSKMSESGEILFSKILNTPFALGYDNFPSKMLLDNDTILVAGSGPTDVGTKGELLKINLNGDILWQKKYSQFPNSTQYAERLRNIKKQKTAIIYWRFIVQEMYLMIFQPL